MCTSAFASRRYAGPAQRGSCSTIAHSPAFVASQHSLRRSAWEVRSFGESGSFASELKGCWRTVWLAPPESKRSLCRRTASSSAKVAEEELYVNPVPRRDTGTCALVLFCIAIFLYERLPILGQGGHPLMAWRLHHDSWFRPMQLVTAAFCHHNYGHLSSNLFGLYVFGRAAEEQVGAGGLVLSYLICAVLANVVSLFWIHGHVVSLGASGAVFGLFVAATLLKFQFDWRSLVEFLVLGQFAFSQVSSELTGPRRPGVDSVAHIAGAFAGIIAYVVVRKLRKRT